MLPSLLLVAVICKFGNSAPFSGTLTAVYGDKQETISRQVPPHAAFADSLGETVITDPDYSRRGPVFSDLRNNIPRNMASNNEASHDGALVRRRRLADDKRLDLKMKMQRTNNQVVSLDAIGSYSLYRSENKKTSLKAFGSTELWYNGKGFGLKKPGLGVQFTIYY